MMAEGKRGRCACCDKECSITADGVIRFHVAPDDKPDCKEGPDSRKCKGAGQRPKGYQQPVVEPGNAGYVCRVCNHPVELTSNRRARSHLNTAQTPAKCDGGSDWPLHVAADGTRTDTKPAAAEGFATAHTLDDGNGGHVTHPGAVADCAMPECCTHPGGFDYADDGNGHSGSFCQMCGAEQPGGFSVRCGAMDATDLDACGHCSDCTPCTHPQGFLPAEDAQGQGGRFCPECGAEQPGMPLAGSRAGWRHDDGSECPVYLAPPSPQRYWCTDHQQHVTWPYPSRVAESVAAEEMVDGPDPRNALAGETFPIGAEHDPDTGVPGSALVEQLKREVGNLGTVADRSAAIERMRSHIKVSQLTVGTVFRRHTSKTPDLVYRAKAVDPSGWTATVVTPGPYAGREGTLTNLEEVIQCTDLSGRPRPRPQTQPPSSPVGAPSAAPTTPTTTHLGLAPGSRPATKATVQPATGTTSSPATSSAPTAPEATSTKTASVASNATQFLAGASGDHGEEEGRYDRYGRYKLLHPVTKEPCNWTRATTFAKSISDTYALSQWGLRMALLGATMRPDLVDQARGKNVAEDKVWLDNATAELKTAAGDKVAANLGTLYHSYTELCDRAADPYAELARVVPEEHQADIKAYIDLVHGMGLRPVPTLIEFSTGVLQYEICGTSDRCYQVTKHLELRLPGKVVHLSPGEFVIGDVKGLALTERIPTPDGWTTMGDIQVGDRVFDAYGKPCEVTVKSQTKRIGTYTVRFDDGSSVVCDTEHIWWTSTGPRPGEPTPKSIKEIIATLADPRTGQKHHRVPVAGPLELPDADLPIDPYLLGCWLGDGSHRGGEITKGRDLFEILQADGHVLGKEQIDKRTDQCITRTVRGLRTRLIAQGLQYNKHIPAVYLRASVAQRTALLRGLMDTDGSWNTARRAVTFSTVDKALALQVEELLLSLGQRPNLATVHGHGYGKAVTSYPVSFTPVGIQPFRLPRKAQQAAASVKPVTRSTRRVIVAVEPGPDVDTACIGVDSPTHTYLCGDRMVPTHNTGKDLDYGWQEIAIQLAIYAQGINTLGRWIWPDNPKEPGVWDPDPLAQYSEPGTKVRMDVAVVPHIPVDKSKGKAPALYALDIDSGWNAAVLCERVRSWRKYRKLAGPVLALQAPEAAPAEPVAEPVRPPEPTREPTLAELADSVTSRSEASAVFQKAKAAALEKKITKQELDGLVSRMQKRLAVLTEPGG